VDSLGGAVAAIEAGFFQEEIASSAYAQQLRVEGGETVIVGVNKFGDGQDPPIIPAPDFSALEREQVARLQATRAARDASTVEQALGALRDAAPSFLPSHEGARVELMPLIIEAVRARASVGEIAGALGTVWGKYRPV
jgi:methylmalonyl-CoA mutase, N-terminal domain